jgi:hypothetical protein
MGINPNNKITIIIRMLFAVTLFQQISFQWLNCFLKEPSLIPIVGLLRGGSELVIEKLNPFSP